MNNFLLNRSREKSSLLGLLTAAIGSLLPAVVSPEALPVWMQLINGLIGVVLMCLPERTVGAPAAVPPAEASDDPRLVEAAGQARPPTLRSPAWAGIVAVLLVLAACSPAPDRATRLEQAALALACAADVGREVRTVAKADGDNYDKAAASAEAAALVAVSSPACQALVAR